jgi:tetratricopeptide (TPR) repeat protein
VNSRPIGREAEVGKICAFLTASSSEPAAVAITGDVGIGKTAVWKHVAQAALRPSFRVLSCRPASSERPLAFSALDDLLGDVIEEFLPELPESRRRAVNGALARGPFLGSMPDRQVLARGILDAFRILSRATPLLVAVDDAQWLDHPSASVLEFCFRRLEQEPVSILLTFRGADRAPPLGLDRAMSPDRLSHVKLGPLSLGAIGEILRTRLGVGLPRYTLTKLYEACGGNPFYALESARALVEYERTALGSGPIPVPDSLGDLVRHRLRGLSPEARDVGRLVAASSNPRERVIRAAHGVQESWVAIDQAIDDGIIERDGDALRFTHPLLRSVLYAEMTLNQRRHVHQRLAAIVEGIEERAWHLALGAEQPSEEIAEILDGAAEHAESRGAPQTAAVLEEQATRLTPASDSGKARERSVRAAYGIHPDLRVWLDVEEFESRVGNGRHCEEAGDTDQATREYESADGLYRGDFLAEDLYEEWAALTRDHLRLAHLDALSRLSNLHFSGGRYATCAALCRRIIECDPCREDAHRRLMRSYSRQGQSHLALMQYQACARALAAELGVDADPATASLHDQIRRHEPV